MDKGYLIMIFFVVANFLLLKNTQRRESIMTWLYLLSGGLSLYSIESADINQPICLTALLALLLCLIPTIIDSLLLRYNSTSTLKRETHINYENYTITQRVKPKRKKYKFCF